MTNREKYNFDFFTLNNYSRMIELALEQDFKFELFKEEYDWSKKIVLWRHDVEFSPYVALEMAKTEANLGVKSTYFFQVHAETYNFFERAISDIALEIKSLGHEIGLHFDSHYWEGGRYCYSNGMGCEWLERCIKRDARYFEDCIEVKPKVFSFHCTNDFIKSCENMSYGGLLNVYSFFFKRNFAYCADSTGIWRYERLDDRLCDENIRHLQVLTHDAMWSRVVMSPRRRVFAAIDERAQRTKEWYDKTLIRFSAENIDEY